MSSTAELAARVERLEELAEGERIRSRGLAIVEAELRHHLARQKAAAEITATAEHMALYSMLSEVAERLAVDPESFRDHYRARVEWWQHRCLCLLEDTEPTKAAALATNTPDVSEYYEPLFGQSPDDWLFWPGNS